jgi:peptidoglycan/LPS O-acetylase OafA/YrhL
VFCYHLLVLGLVERALSFQVFTGRFWTLFVWTLTGSVFLATVSFYAVERPLLRWGRKGERLGAHAAETAAPTAINAAS